MMDVRVLLATADDIDAIVADARPADVAEVLAASGHSLHEVLVEGLEISSLAWTGLVDGTPVCMFGVAPAPGMDGVGVPWMIGTNAVESYATVFLRRNRDVLEQMKALFPVLINYVDERNTASIRWLRWMGFNIHPAEPYGVSGLPFCRFDLGVQPNV